MTDPVTTIGAGLAIIGSKDILLKLLGPTADYIGGEIKGFVEKCNINLDRIFLKSVNKLGTRIEEPETISPRILKQIIDEGRFCDEELTSEYYAGILASSRSKSNRDDRGITHLATIRQLSFYQIRLHYLFYTLIIRHFKGTDDKPMRFVSERNKLRIYIPLSTYEYSMEFTEDEDSKSILAHSVTGLIKHELIGKFRFYGRKEQLKKYYSKPSEYGLITQPTLLGAELFLWAEGFANATGYELLDENVKIREPIIPICEGSVPLFD